MLRIVSWFLAANGALMLWIARYGALWRYDDWLPGFYPYVLRPGMVVIGLWSVVLGLWYGGGRGTTPGRVLTTWVDDMRDDIRSGALADLGWRKVAWLYARELRHRSGCMIGRHTGLVYLNNVASPGVCCEHCGLDVPMQLSWYDRLDSYLAGHATGLWRWLHRKEIARGDWLPGDEDIREIVQQPSRRYPSDREAIHVLYPDGQHRLEDLPGDIGTENCRACNRPIEEHDVGEYDDECPYFVPSGRL